jgi:hypothetical protein
MDAAWANLKLLYVTDIHESKGCIELASELCKG